MLWDEAILDRRPSSLSEKLGCLASFFFDFCALSSHASPSFRSSDAEVKLSSESLGREEGGAGGVSVEA